MLAGLRQSGLQTGQWGNRMAPAKDGQSKALEKVTTEELKEICAAHKEWLDSHEKSGRRAVLKHKDLSGTALNGADLRRAAFPQSNLDHCSLVGADLRGAGFDGTSLRGANLLEADLQGADLSEVDLTGAELFRTTLSNTSLINADLTDTKSLTKRQLARADLTNAILPSPFQLSNDLEHVQALSGQTSRAFIVLLLTLTYCWLTLASTSDAGILIGASKSKLPLIDAEIPISWFYWLMPVVLLCMNLYFHLCMKRLWADLSELPSFFTDGKAVYQKVSPLLLNVLLQWNFEKLRDTRHASDYLEYVLSIFLAWVLVPATLIAFWLRFLVRHDWLVMSIQIASAVLTIWLCGYSLILTSHILRGVQAEKRIPVGRLVAIPA